MMWNRQLRYTPYKEWSTKTLKDLKKQVRHSKWKMNHHIHPESGLLNDPNGFSYFNNKWHLFYQSYPYGPVHGLKSWKHLTSTDLVTWKDEGTAIYPDSKYDSHGAYTGTSIVKNGKLFIMYTGNVRTKEWQRESYQNGAWMNKDGKVTKINNPLISNAPAGYTTSIRDPYLLSKDGKYYAVIGGQTKEEQGSELIYESNDLEDWNFVGPLNIPRDISGFMIECPNIVFIDGKPVLIFCPQGLDKSQFDYQNIYPNVYSVADGIDLEHAQVINQRKIEQLDDGFDVYATEAINTPDKRALAVSWIGLPEIEYPTDIENWAHCLSVIKELTLKNNHLYQNPVSELKRLRINQQEITEEKKTIELDSNNGSFELEIEVPKDQKLDFEVTNSKEKGSLNFSVDAVDGIVTVDRSKTGNPFAEKYGQTRTSKVKSHEKIRIQLIIDVSVFECYIDNGYSVITGRFFLNNFPDKVQIKNKTSKYKGQAWEWNK